MPTVKRKVSLALVIGMILLVNGVLAQVEVLPETITINNMTTGHAEIVRTMVLTASQNVTGLRIVPMDILRNDGMTFFPAGNLYPDLNVSMLNTSDIAIVPITFVIDQNVTSGLYTGSLMIKYLDGKTLIPVTMQIKDPIVLPVLILIVTILVSTWYFSYGAKGRKKALLKREIKNLQNQMSADDDLVNGVGRPFSTRIYEAIDVAKFDIDAEKFDDANESLLKARNMHKKWIGDRSGWIKALGDCQKLLTKVEALEISLDGARKFLYLRDMKEDLTSLMQSAPDTDNSGAFSSLLGGKEDGYDIFKYTTEVLIQIQGICILLPTAAEKAACKNRLQLFWEALALKDRNKLEEIEKQILDVAIQYREELENSVPSPNKGLIPPNPLRPEEKKPGPGRSKERKAGEGKNDEWIDALGLAAHSWLSYFLAAAALFGLGLLELYINNPTFGASVADYIAVFFWGFGIGPASEGAHQKFRDSVAAAAG